MLPVTLLHLRQQLWFQFDRSTEVQERILPLREGEAQGRLHRFDPFEQVVAERLVVRGATVHVNILQRVSEQGPHARRRSHFDQFTRVPALGGKNHVLAVVHQVADNRAVDLGRPSLVTPRTRLLQSGLFVE